MDEITSFDNTKRQTINPLIDRINQETEPLLKVALKEFGQPLSLTFRLYNQIRFYEEYGKLHLGVSVASKETLANQFDATVKQIEVAFNNLTNKYKLGKWVDHNEPIFRNVKRTWVSNTRYEKGFNNYYSVIPELLQRNSTTITAYELPTDKPPLSESKKKLSESKTLSKDKGLKPEKYGRDDINELLEYWNKQVGYQITSKRQANRNAAKNLIAKYGLERTKKLIDGAGMAQNDKYAPRIADIAQLQQKTNELMAWGKTKYANSSQKGRVL